MNDMNKPDIQKLIAGRLEELGLTRLSRMFSVEHNVPRGTHKAIGSGVGGNADTAAEAENADMVDGFHMDQSVKKDSRPEFAGVKLTKVPMLPGYSKRKRIDLPIPDANLTDFPNCIKIVADAKIGAGCLANGHDIRFTAADGVTELPYEREVFSGGGGAPLTAIIWVKSNVSTAGTYVWIYYGNASAADGENATAVWDAAAKAVYHMKDLTTSTIKDSTANGNNGTKLAANEPIEATGKVGKGQTFDGLNDRISCGSGGNLDIGTQDFAVEACIKPNGAGNSLGAIICKYSHIQTHGFFVSLNSFRPMIFIWASGSYIWANIGSVNVVDGVYSHVAINFDRDGDAECFINGVSTGTLSISTQSGNINTTSPLWLGHEAPDSGYYKGDSDEVRLTIGTLRSAAWIKYGYANMAAADGGLTWGEEDVFSHVETETDFIQFNLGGDIVELYQGLLHLNTNDPTADQKAALPGTSGTPSGTNKYVTNADARNADARTPVAHNHAATEINSGTLDGDRLPALSATKKGGAPATGTPSGKFLKDDNTWATPGGGGDMQKATYDTDDDGKVDQAQNADTVDNKHASDFLEGTYDPDYRCLLVVK